MGHKGRRRKRFGCPGSWSVTQSSQALGREGRGAATASPRRRFLRGVPRGNSPAKEDGGNRSLWGGGLGPHLASPAGLGASPDSVGLPMAFWGTIQTPSSLHHLPDPSSHKRLVSKTRELPDPTVSLNHHFSDLSISQILIP